MTQVARAVRHSDELQLRIADTVERRMQPSVDFVQRSVKKGRSIYGVTTGFGAMSDVPVSKADAAASQANLLAFLAAGAGVEVNARHTRLAMLLRANMLSQGHSGVRFEVVRRLIQFLNADFVPVVRQLGSIGASGDLVPLATVARAITGQSGFVQVRVGDQTLPGEIALRELGLAPLPLLPKEALAIVNGTTFSSAIAANSVHEARTLLSVVMGVQGMMLTALQCQREPFEEFVHQHKPHPGQIWSAGVIRSLLREDSDANQVHGSLVQDRYSLRCLPQYMGSIVEGIARITRVVEIEMNAVSDNPLIDPVQMRFYQSGNFLGQYIGIAMDDLRRFIGLTAKHLDVQIATLVTPEFSNGLPSSLRGNGDVSYNMGMKGLQITGNSIVPLLTHAANPIVEHFPTHAEQFNQNINGLSWGSANLAWESVEIFRRYLSIALIISLQALDLRAKSQFGHFDGRALLRSELVHLYEAACNCLSSPPGEDRPFLFNDQDRWLEQDIESLVQDLRIGRSLEESVRSISKSFDECFELS
ncbi:MAG: aromatic amino acid lyase [Planctomycetaceae bacterium]|nr:aromatic amino acid lyase [Planctomycetaceae bacterium]